MKFSGLSHVPPLFLSGQTVLSYKILVGVDYGTGQLKDLNRRE